MELTLISQATHVQLQALKLSPKAKSQPQRPQEVTALTSWLDCNEEIIKAVQCGNETEVRQLLSRGADVNVSDGKYSGALQAAS